MKIEKLNHRPAELVNGEWKMNATDSKINEVIDVLNTLLSKQEKGEWPKEGSTYFYVNEYGRLDYRRWAGNEWDESRLGFGNCFPTREAAESALEKINSALKDL